MTNTASAMAAVGLLICIGVPVRAQTVMHPLDPLTFQEYWTVLETLRDAGRLNDLAKTTSAIPPAISSCPA